MASTTANQAKDAAGNLADKAKDAVNYGADKAKDLAAAGADKARQGAAVVGQKAEDLTASAGKGIESLAHTLRDSAPKQGMMGSAATAVADTLESSGRYLQEEGLSGMAADMTDLIKRNPVSAVLVGVGIGYLLAKATRS